MSLADFERVDSKEYGLTNRTALYRDSDNQLTLIVSRKGRVIMKDAEKLIEKLKVVEKSSGVIPSLLISAPLCSKAKAFLVESEIHLVEIGEE